MKKTIKIAAIALLSLMALGYGGYRYINWSFNQPCEPPSKPKSVPLSAEWKGGCDGGVWLDFVSYDSEMQKFRFRVYSSSEGKLLLDADYQLTEECQSEVDIVPESNILERIGLAINYQRKIHIKNNKLQDCYLIPIYPAYGGDDWEIIKEKGEWEEAQN